MKLQPSVNLIQETKSWNEIGQLVIFAATNHSYEQMSTSKKSILHEIKVHVLRTNAQTATYSHCNKKSIDLSSLEIHGYPTSYM